MSDELRVQVVAAATGVDGSAEGPYSLVEPTCLRLTQGAAHQDHVLDQYLPYGEATPEARQRLTDYIVTTVTADLTRNCNFVLLNCGQSSRKGRLEAHLDLVVQLVDRFAAKTKPDVSLRMLNIHDNLARDLFNNARAVDVGPDSELGTRRLLSEKKPASLKECAAVLMQGHKASRRLFKTNHRAVRGNLVTYAVIGRAGASESPVTAAVVDLTVPELRVTALPTKGLGARESSHAVQACDALFRVINHSRTTEGASANTTDSAPSSSSLSVLAHLLRPLLLRSEALIHVVAGLDFAQDSAMRQLKWLRRLRDYSSCPLPPPPKPPTPPREATPHHIVEEKWESVAKPLARLMNLRKSSDDIKLSGRLHVAIAIRPFRETELAAGCYRVHTTHASQKAVTIVDPGRRGWSTKNAQERYEADFVWDMTRPERGHNYGTTERKPWHVRAGTMADVYGDIGSKFVDRAWHGKDSTLLIYGTAGSGKQTFVGLRQRDGGDHGLLFHVLEDIFQRGSLEAGTSRQFRVSLSAAEVYLSKVYDLLVNRKYVNRMSKCTFTHIKSAKHGQQVLAETVCKHRKRASISSTTATTRGHLIIDLEITRSNQGRGENGSKAHIRVVVLASTATTLVSDRRQYTAVAADGDSPIPQANAGESSEISDTHRSLQKYLVWREGENTRRRRVQKVDECIQSGDAIARLVEGQGAKTLDTVVAHCKQYYRKQPFLVVKNKVEAFASKTKQEGSKFQSWTLNADGEAALGRCPPMEHFLLWKEAQADEAAAESVDEESGRDNSVVLNLEAGALAPDAYITCLAIVPPMNTAFDTTTNSLRYLSFLTGETIAAMGEKADERQAAMHWQTRVNLAMLQRLKETRKRRQQLRSGNETRGASLVPSRPTAKWGKIRQSVNALRRMRSLRNA